MNAHNNFRDLPRDVRVIDCRAFNHFIMVRFIHETTTGLCINSTVCKTHASKDQSELRGWKQADENSHHLFFSRQVTSSALALMAVGRQLKMRALSHSFYSWTWTKEPIPHWSLQFTLVLYWNYSLRYFKDNLSRILMVHCAKSVFAHFIRSW